MTDPNARLVITARDATKAAWNSALGTAKSGAAKIGSEIKSLFTGFAAGVSIAGLKNLINEALEYGDAIGKAATKSGLGTNAISELAFAAKGADVELTDLSAALSKLQVNVSKAADGNKNLRDSFAELGVRFEKFRDAKADKQFESLAEAINRVPDEADKLRLAVEVLGPSGAKLLPLFSDGAEGIRKLREEFVRLGLSLNEEDQKKLESAGDALEEMKGAAAGLGRVIGITLAPAIKEAADDLKNFIGLTKNATSEIGSLYQKIQDNEKAKGALEFLKVVLNPIGTARSLALKAASNALTKDDPRPPFLYLPPAKDPLLGDPRPPRKEGDPEFTDEELAEFLGTGGSAARRRNRGDTQTTRDRSQDSIFEGNLERYENERKILEDLDRNIAESSARIFEENEDAIAGYLENIERDSLETLEVQTSVFEELGATIEGSLADAFYNAGEGARGFATAVLDSFKRIIADAAAKKVVELVTGLFSNGGGGGSSSAGGGATGGFSSLIAGALLGGLGGARATGGPVTGGVGYLIGERGPELFVPGQSGAVLPNSSLRGGMSINVANNISIDARGATQDGAKELMAQMPAILERNRRQTKAEIREEINRGHFGLKG